jgi:hypothetical protein
MLLDTIPSDILLLIINNLDCKDVISLLKVNKYFNIFIEDNKNYINFNSSINIYDMNDINIEYLVKKLPNVKHRYYLRNRYYLDYINFKYNNNIYELNLQLCKSVNNNIFNYINISSISIIDLSYNSSITDLTCFKNNNSINKLILRNCMNISDFSFLETCNYINYLDLSGTKISDLSCLKNNKYIDTLILEYCRMLQDISVFRFNKNILPLKYIDLSCCNNLGDLSVLGMFENINYIKLFRYKGKIDLSFLEKCKNIDTLILSDTMVTDTSKIKNIKPNGYIDLSWTNINCITDVGKVNYLNLSNCNQLKDVSNLKNSQINFLNLYECERISDISMLSHIPTINIRRCSLINIYGLTNIQL